MNDSSPRTERKHGGNHMAMACQHIVRALDTMHPRLVFHFGVGVRPANFKRNIFVAPDRVLTGINHRNFPADCRAIALIHFKKIRSKKSGFIAAHTSADFNYGLILRVAFLLRRLLVVLPLFPIVVHKKE